jgi:hypothetical protein
MNQVRLINRRKFNIDSVIFTSNGRNISTCYDFNATVKIDPLPTEISNMWLYYW